MRTHCTRPLCVSLLWQIVSVSDDGNHFTLDEAALTGIIGKVRAQRSLPQRLALRSRLPVVAHASVAAFPRNGGALAVRACPAPVGRVAGCAV